MSKYDKIDRWCPNQPASMSFRKDGRYMRYVDVKDLLEACKRKDELLEELINSGIFSAYCLMKKCQIKKFCDVCFVKKISNKINAELNREAI